MCNEPAVLLKRSVARSVTNVRRGLCVSSPSSTSIREHNPTFSQVAKHSSSHTHTHDFPFLIAGWFPVAFPRCSGVPQSPRVCIIGLSSVRHALLPMCMCCAVLSHCKGMQTNAHRLPNSRQLRLGLCPLDSSPWLCMPLSLRLTADSPQVFDESCQ